MNHPLRDAQRMIAMDRARRQLARNHAKNVTAAAPRCPECGETADIEDNGAAGTDRGYRCGVCGRQWGMAIGQA